MNQIYKIMKTINVNVSNVNVSKLERRKARKNVVRIAKKNEVSLSSRTKNLLKVATETESGKQYLKYEGLTAEDAKNIFTVPNIKGMHSTLIIDTKELERFKEFFQIRKYNKERDNGTFLYDGITIDDIKTDISILDIKRFRTSSFENMFIENGKLFIVYKDIKYVFEQIETISIFHIVQKIGSYRDERQRIATVEQRKKDYKERKKQKEQSAKDKQKAQKAKSNKEKKWSNLITS